MATSKWAGCLQASHSVWKAICTRNVRSCLFISGNPGSEASHISLKSELFLGCLALGLTMEGSKCPGISFCCYIELLFSYSPASFPSRYSLRLVQIIWKRMINFFHLLSLLVLKLLHFTNDLIVWNFKRQDLLLFSLATFFYLPLHSKWWPNIL